MAENMQVFGIFGNSKKHAMKSGLQIHHFIKKTTFQSLVLMGLALVLSCSSNDAATGTMPTNLTVFITIEGATNASPGGDGSGKVLVSAYAKDAVRFAFKIEEGDLQQSSTREIAHTFSREGTHTYSIEVYAYGSSGEFISETTSVEVFKSSPVSANLIFSDEFDYEGSPDNEKWYFQVEGPNNGSWYNGEEQHYTDRAENSYVSNGTLKINAIKEDYTSGGTTKLYTSARLNSKSSFTYGRVEVRAKLPAEAGTWPAIWTLGTNINEPGNYYGDQDGSVGWPACGEIDIMEQKGWDKNNTIGYFHWGDTNTGEYKNTGGETTVANASDEFHMYILEWDSNSLKVLVDDTLVYELTNTQDKPYDNPHYLLLNIAMGGNLGGEIPVDFSEATMEIDYVRVYQ